MFRYLRIKYIFFLVCFATISNGQENVINSLDIKVSKGRIWIVPHLEDFIDEDMHSVIASGLSTNLHFYFELNKTNGNNIIKQDEIVLLKNDVWEKYYLIKFEDFSKRLKNYNRFKEFLFDSLQFNLGSIKNIKNNEKLSISFTFSTENISPSHKEKIEYWLSNSSPGKVGDENESSFSVNISKLISFFLSNTKKKNIHLYKSKTFTIQSVSNNAQTQK
jgi:hypothetical protein